MRKTLKTSRIIKLEKTDTNMEDHGIFGLLLTATWRIKAKRVTENILPPSFTVIFTLTLLAIVNLSKECRLSF
jgi:hypothetical protein